MTADSSETNPSPEHQIRSSGLHSFNIPLQILQTWERLDFGSHFFPLWNRNDQQHAQSISPMQGLTWRAAATEMPPQRLRHSPVFLSSTVLTIFRHRTREEARCKGSATMEQADPAGSPSSQNLAGAVAGDTDILAATPPAVGPEARVAPPDGL